MKSLYFILFSIFFSLPIMAADFSKDINISSLDFTPIRISIITSLSSNKIITSPLTKSFFKDSYAFQMLDAKDILLAFEVNRKNDNIMDSKNWQSSDLHKIASILRHANIDVILIPAKEGESWTLFYLNDKSLRKLSVSKLKKAKPSEAEFRSALSSSLGYQAFVLKVKGKQIVAALIKKDTEVAKQGLILEKSNKMLAVSSAVSGTHLLSLLKKDKDIALFKPIVEGNRKIEVGAKILMKQ